MRIIIGAKLLTSHIAQPASKPFEIYDMRLRGFTLRVQPSGVRSYYARLGANHRIALGKVGEFSPDEARERCQKVLGNVAHGRHPRDGLDGVNGITLGQFIQETYARWAKANRPRTAANTLEKLHRHFGSWFPDPLCAITADRIESWKQRRLNAGRTATTILRDLFTLSSVLSRAVKLGKLAENPVRRVDKPRIDRRGKVRFLDDAEESRLRDALHAWDVERATARKSANIWRQARNETLLPPLLHFADHLTPAVLLSMNTGLRRGELLKLRWSSVDITGRLLTIEGANAKSRQTRHIPLNDEAISVLTRWHEQSGDGHRVFEIATGLKTAWSHLLKRAQINAFRWHDLRHHFASRLVQRGVPLNTVRDLLGHSSVAMSLRYAHLAPDQRREAVAKLNEKSIPVLTIRLPWKGEPTGVMYPLDLQWIGRDLNPRPRHYEFKNAIFSDFSASKRLPSIIAKVP
jgi:integrase